MVARLLGLLAFLVLLPGCGQPKPPDAQAAPGGPTVSVTPSPSAKPVPTDGSAGHPPGAKGHPPDAAENPTSGGDHTQGTGADGAPKADTPDRSKPIYGLPLEYHFDVPEVPEKIQWATPERAVAH